MMEVEAPVGRLSLVRGLKRCDPLAGIVVAYFFLPSAKKLRVASGQGAPPSFHPGEFFLSSSCEMIRRGRALEYVCFVVERRSHAVDGSGRLRICRVLWLDITVE